MSLTDTLANAFLVEFLGCAVTDHLGNLFSKSLIRRHAIPRNHVSSVLFCFVFLHLGHVCRLYEVGAEPYSEICVCWQQWPLDTSIKVYHVQ